MQGIRFVEKAIESEIIRQVELLEAGQAVVQQTRRYDVAQDQTVLLRQKEQDLDYRFMYDPDLPTYFISVSSDLCKIVYFRIMWIRLGHKHLNFHLTLRKT